MTTTTTETCPAWCTLTEQYHRDYGSGHAGPTFESLSDASVGTWQDEGAKLELSVWIDGDSCDKRISDPEQARRLARALLAAAEWLEAQR